MHACIIYVCAIINMMLQGFHSDPMLAFQCMVAS